MSNVKYFIGIAAAGVVLLPAIANASLVLDTGTPTNFNAPFDLTSSQFIAGEFAATAGDNIVDLSAYLTTGAAGALGDTFTFDVYSNASFLGVRSSSRPAPVYSATGNFAANGWNTTAVNWTPATSGDYWLALQVNSPGNSKGIAVPLEASPGTGTASAIAFAYTTSATGAYTASTAFPIGLQVTDVAPVPLPPSVWLLSSGLLVGFGSGLRRHRKTATG